jgi:hypothetical protein
MLEARVQPVDLAAHGRLLGGGSVLGHTGKGITGVSLVLDWIPASGNANLPVGIFFLVAVVSFGIVYSFVTGCGKDLSHQVTALFPLCL